MFTNAKVEGNGISSAVYLNQSVARGDAKYVIGRSDLCEIAACPNKWKNAQPEDDNPVMIWGTLIDALLFGVDINHIAVTPATYTNDKGVVKPWNWNADVCDQWRTMNKGKTIVKPDIHANVMKAVKQIREDADVAALLNCSTFQTMVTGLWTDEATQLTVPLKILVDICPNKDNADYGNKLADLKTTYDASPFQWARSIFTSNYHVQAAFYLDLYNAATGENRDTFLHVVQESAEPYQLAKRRLSDEYLKLGRAQYHKALSTYCQCLKDNTWQGYEEQHIINGWSNVDPEPWMILRAGVEVEPTDNTKNW